MDRDGGETHQKLQDTLSQDMKPELKFRCAEALPDVVTTARGRVCCGFFFFFFLSLSLFVS